VGILRGENDQGFGAEESVFLEIKAKKSIYLFDITFYILNFF